MGSPFQQQSRQRKILYTFLIVVLFTGTLVLRQVKGGIESQAESLELREESQGEVGLTDSAIRLTLTGSRGLATVVLWWAAIDKQMKHEWNQLELLTISLTKLQPHFITPWLFQSWNLAYNVSVESDRIRDKYFYMTRGIELLARGERQNKNNPDLRFSMGFYNQHKIGLSDEANTLRCLYQMSCIDPVERDPSRLRMQDRSGSTSVDMPRFEQFCRRHPMLVRRLREVLKKDTPADIVDFLADNQKIPSRFQTPDRNRLLSGSEEVRTPLLPPDEQFPQLPPLEGDNKADPDHPDFDNFHTARDWYIYSNQPLPPAEPVVSALRPPYDPRKYRLPRYMAAEIFRGYPARGQTYVADYLEKEGWFDTEGWKINGWFPDDKFQNGDAAVVANDTVSWGQQAWGRSYEMYKAYGVSLGLYVEPEALKDLEDKAARFRQRFGINPGDLGIALPEEFRGTEYEDDYKAHVKLYWYNHTRSMTNFPHFYFRSEVESNRDAIAVRKAFFKANQLRTLGEREEALRIYHDELPNWRQIMLEHPDFRADDLVQEESFETELEYLKLVRDLRGKRYKELLVMADYLTQVAFMPPLSVMPMPSPLVVRDTMPNFRGPLDGTGPRDSVINPDIQLQVLRREGLVPNQPAPPMSRPPGAMGGQMPPNRRMVQPPIPPNAKQ
jgi:hypothetical protein